MTNTLAHLLMSVLHGLTTQYSVVSGLAEPLHTLSDTAVDDVDDA